MIYTLELTEFDMEFDIVQLKKDAEKGLSNFKKQWFRLYKV